VLNYENFVLKEGRKVICVEEEEGLLLGLKLGGKERLQNHEL
jgi:hypothetical protein